MVAVDVGQITTERVARGSLRQKRLALDGQVVIGRDRVTWFLSSPEAELVDRTRVEWRAGRAYRESRGDMPFLPSALKNPPVVLFAFLALPGGSGDVMSLGRVHLGSYGYSGAGRFGDASMTLFRPLNQEDWLRAGGHRGFGFTLGDDERINGLDAAAALEHLERALSSGDNEVWITDYSPQPLVVLVNPDRAFVMTLEDDGAIAQLAGDPGAVGDTTLEPFRLSNGQIDKFERCRTVTHEQARSCVASYLDGRALDNASILIIE